MKIEDELRDTLKRRAEHVATDPPSAWSEFERRSQRTIRSQRVVAAVFAVVIGICGVLLAIRAFGSNSAIQPSTAPAYASTFQIQDVLRAHHSCERASAVSPSPLAGVQDSGTCHIDGHPVLIYVFSTPESMASGAKPPTTPEGGTSWVSGANWFIVTDAPDVATSLQSILGGDILGGTGQLPSESVAPTSQSSSNPLDRPKLKHVLVVPQRVVASSPDTLIVEAPVGEVRWKLNKECGVTGAPVGGSNAGGFGGGGCDGGALAGNVGGLSVAGTFYDMIRGHAYFGQEVTVRATFVDGTTTQVATHNGMWMIVYRPKPDLYSPASQIATVEAISPAGQLLDRIKVP